MKGAFEKARDKLNKEHPRSRSKSPRPVKALTEDDSHGDDADSESDLHPLGSMVCTSVFGLRCCGMPELITEDDDDDDDFLCGICCDEDSDDDDDSDKPYLMTMDDSSKIEIETDADVDQLLKIFAFPEGKTPMCAAPSTDGLKPGETWAMMDSGAGCHAAHATKHFPKHPKRRSRTVRKCVLADGSPMESSETVDVLALIDGEKHTIEFDDLPVECPIISVRKIVRKGNRVVFQENGGYIVNTTSKKKLHFVEKQGVYFIKLDVVPPTEDFPRRGR